MREVNSHICRKNQGRHQQNQKHTPKGKYEDSPKYYRKYDSRITQPRIRLQIGYCKMANRIKNNTSAKIVKDGKPVSRRMPSRPPKRWRDINIIL